MIRTICDDWSNLAPLVLLLVKNRFGFGPEYAPIVTIGVFLSPEGAVTALGGNGGGGGGAGDFLDGLQVRRIFMFSVTLTAVLFVFGDIGGGGGGATAGEVTAEGEVTTDGLLVVAFNGGADIEVVNGFFSGELLMTLLTELFDDTPLELDSLSSLSAAFLVSLINLDLRPPNIFE